MIYNIISLMALTALVTVYGIQYYTMRELRYEIVADRLELLIGPISDVGSVISSAFAGSLIVNVAFGNAFWFDPSRTVSAGIGCISLAVLLVMLIIYWITKHTGKLVSMPVAVAFLSFVAFALRVAI